MRSSAEPLSLPCSIYAGSQGKENAEMKLRRICLICLASALLILSFFKDRTEAADLPGTAQYQTTTEGGWSFTIVPFYGWLQGQRGTVGVLGTTEKIDVTPIDIIENFSDYLDVLDGVYMGAGELRYGDFGFFYDVVYIDVFSTEAIEGEFAIGDLDVGFSQVMATLTGSYRVHQANNGYLDVLAGVRIRDIDLNVGLNLNFAASTLSDGDTWVDPLIGGKGRFNVSENVYLSGWTLIGGFGAGSKFMWDVWGNVGYQVNDWFDVFLGFRAEGTDYQSDGFIWDVIQYGPLVGATFKLF